jgi:hypothetical protein
MCPSFLIFVRLHEQYAALPEFFLDEGIKPDEPQRHREHSGEKDRRREGKMILLLFAFSLCPLCLCGS